MSRKEAPLESPESSSPIITRAVAAGLRGEFIENLPLVGWQRAALRLLGRLPQEAARTIVSRVSALSAIDPSRVERLTVEQLAEERVKDYAKLVGRRFPAVVTGAPLGGAAAHLALALDGPFLPQAFVLTLRGGSPDGDPQAYFRLSDGLAGRLTAANPGILTIQHYDPVHDGWLTRFANHLRFKLLELPDAYAKFLLRHLEPDGAVVYLDCQAAWLRYRVGERRAFQVGGWGGISPEEFLEGSPRLRDYCRSAGLAICDWRLKDFPLERGPESEWGSEPGLGDALESFCREHGFRFVPIRLPGPHDYSRLAFRAQAALLEKAGREPAGVFVETFTQYDAAAVQQAGLLPLWLVFNTSDSLRFLETMRPHFPAGKPVLFSPLITFSLTPDMAPWGAWEAALAGLDWRNVGARPDRYPADAVRLAGWQQALHAWVARHENPVRETLAAEALAELTVQE